MNEAELVATDADNEAISNAVPKPSFSRVKGLKKTTATIIVMDLETTGLSRWSFFFSLSRSFELWTRQIVFDIR